MNDGYSRAWLLLLGLLISVSLSQPEADGALTGEYHEAYYLLSELNAGLTVPPEPLNLQTPQAALELFVRAARDKDYERAAHTLNLNLYPTPQQQTVAPELAEEMFYLLETKRLINYDALPDRPDAQVTVAPGTDNPLAGQPQRSVELAVLELGGRQTPIRLQRVRVGDSAPVWVFSANTVANIPALYDMYGPTALDRALPPWAKSRVFGVALWEYAALVLVLALAIGLGILVGRVSSWIAERAGDVVAGYLIGKLTGPITLVVAFGLLFGMTSGTLPFTDAFLNFLQPVMWVSFVGAVIWLGVRIINYVAERYRDTYIEDLDDDSKEAQRKRRTVISVGRRAFIFVALLVGLGVMLSEFANLELLGTTLLTSAGIAGAVIGIAAQPTLGNIIAGIQVAVTQPVRIGDTVMYDDSWAYVEDLRYTYAVIRTWDERRFIVPMRDLITEPLENWTHTDTHQASAVYLYVDFGTDISALREKFVELVKASGLWCGETEPELLAVETLEDRLKLRGKVSAKNPSDAWALECEVREKMNAYLGEAKDGDYLPRERLAVQEVAG